MEDWTIATPFVDKGAFVTKLWLRSFDNLDIPRCDFNLVWLNMCSDSNVKKILTDYLSDHGKEFKSVNYINNADKKLENVPWDNGPEEGNYLLKRSSVSETMNILKSYRVNSGHMIIYEDDIIVPRNSWSFMKHIFDYDTEFYAVTGVQYTRNLKWNNGEFLLVWDWDRREQDGMVQDVAVGRTFDKERFTGIEFVGATATGFILLRKEFLNQHTFGNYGNDGQDVMLGHHIYKINKKLALCWDLKFPHIGMNRIDGRFRVHRSPMCQTEVLDEYGTRF